MKKREKIKEYWDERAKQHLNSPTATTNDIHLRELEIETLVKTFQENKIPENGIVLDAGCGDGYSLIKIAEKLPNFSFVGLDYSENMIKIANDRLSNNEQLKGRVKFVTGDLTNLKSIFDNLLFDVIITDRCLINLESFESQIKAISEIIDCLKSDGYYLGIENFIEGQNNMNKFRSSMGLAEIPIRWHNLFLKEEKFLQELKKYFQSCEIHDFSSSYYFATRVIYSAMCQMKGEEPDYDHEIHKLAVRLPWFGKFSPIRLVICKKKSRGG